MLDFLKKNETPVESYWSILIENQWVTSAIWQIKNEKVEIISSSPGTRWEGDLTEAVDATLSSCTQNLAEDFQDPNKTVFGVSSSWIEDGNIKDEYLVKLKKICEDLSLTPSGFVVLSEAISHFVKSKEQTFFSGITLGVSDQSLDISVFNLGKLLGTTIVARSISASDDLLEGLSRLTGDFEDFPSRIILYNQKESELEEIKNNLNEIDWEKIETLKFLHAPKIEILNPSDKILAVSLAGGSEIGGIQDVTYNNFNFNEQSDNQKFEEDVVKNVQEPIGLNATDFGFTVDTSSEPKKPFHTVSILPKIPKFSLRMPRLPKLNFFLSGRPFIFGGIFLTVILLFAFLAWWFLPKATVTIFVASKKLEDNLIIKLKDDLSSTEVETSVSGDKTKSTTGTKTVGEKATGQAKILNGTDKPVNLSAGTTLLSSTNLKFVLLKSASMSAALSTTEPGLIIVDVEAGNIGSEFNLSKDEKFKVSNYPRADIEAVSIDNFSGGSSRQISAVSEDDRKKLREELNNELTLQAKNKLNSQISDDKVIIDSTLVLDIEDENFSNKVGDEATTIKLSFNLKFTAKAVAKNDLNSISKKALFERIPDGFVLRDDQIDYFFSEPVEKDNLPVKITANLLPTIDTLDIAKKIAGKYPVIAEDYLSSVPGFTNAEFRLPSLLRGKLATLPHLHKNIEINISSDQ